MTKLDRTKPSLTHTVDQSHEKMHSKITTQPRRFSVGDHVLVKDDRNGDHKWIPGVIDRITGPVSYEVKVSHGNTWRRHVDQVLSSVGQPFSEPQLQIPISDTTVDVVPAEPKPSIECLDNLPEPFLTLPTIAQASAPENKSSTPVRCYPLRNRKPVVKLDL